MSDILETLFGSKERARILRFFLQNSDSEFEFADIYKKNLLNSDKAKREVNGLVKIKFLNKRKKKGKVFYVLNQSFNYYPELKNLIAKSNVYPQCKSLGNIKPIGDVRYAAISGTFINYPKSKADLIIVGEKISRPKLKNLIDNLEAEIGKEISFVLMSSEEMKYRLNMLDKFLLEFFEGPHEEIINKMAGLRKFIVSRK